MNKYAVKHFLITLAAFLVLGVSFKVMVLVEGLTEVRPVNAIPQVAGLVCGPAGAFACAAGNLLADMAGTLSPSSILGMVGNFVAAYLPYRLWHMFSEEKPNLHSGRNILLYCAIALTTSLTVAWILGFGLYFFQGIWIKEIYTYVFINDLGFSIGLGMPLLIILTSDSVNAECCPGPLRYRILKRRFAQRLCAGCYNILLLSIMAGVLIFHQSPEEAVWMMPLSAAALAGGCCQLI